jgi:hypothetical protein
MIMLVIHNSFIRSIEISILRRHLVIFHVVEPR